MQDTQGYNYAPFPICPHAQGHNHHPVVDTGYIMGEIADLEFGTHLFLENHVFLPTEQAGTRIYFFMS